MNRLWPLAPPSSILSSYSPPQAVTFKLFASLALSYCSWRQAQTKIAGLAKTKPHPYRGLCGVHCDLGWLRGCAGVSGCPTTVWHAEMVVPHSRCAERAGAGPIDETAAR